MKAIYLSIPRSLARNFKKVKIQSNRTRLLDVDNFVGGCKPIVDALKEYGLIEDDSPDKVKVEYEQKKTNGNFTVIVLED